MTSSLLTLLQHAERQRDEGHAALLQADDALRRLAEQADQLQAYRNDYRGRHPALGGRSASIELLRCHDGFMQRLDQAIAQQQSQQQAAQTRCHRLRSELLALETRVASVRKLLERRGADDRRSEAQREQRRQDDAARAPRPFESSTLQAWRHSTQTAAL